MKRFFTGLKNIDLIILSFLDDSTLLNFYKVSKYGSYLSNDQIFWKTRLIKKLQKEKKWNKELEELKVEKLSWKMFYLGIAYYRKHYTDCGCLLRTSNEGYLDLVRFFYYKGSKMKTQGFLYAAVKNHKDIIYFYVDKNVRREWGLMMSSEKGYEDLVEIFIQRGAKNWNKALIHAAKGGHKNLVKFFISKGATDLDYAIFNAGMNKHYEIVRYLTNLKRSREIFLKND